MASPYDPATGGGYNQAERPSYVPTALVTFFFGLFGLIPAVRHSRMARERGYPDSGYWVTFAVAMVTATALYVAIVIAAVAIVVSVTRSAVDADKTGSALPVPPARTTSPRHPASAVRPAAPVELAAAKSINGMIFKSHVQPTHVTSLVTYDSSPPTGGNDSQVWADCTGTIYPEQIANENAVHSLAHGAVWITYRPGLDASSVAALGTVVKGQNYTFMTPYAGLKTTISLQTWNYQLFVHSASDPRIAAFIRALRNNPGTTPEYPGNCSNPTFKIDPSTPGHPIWQ
jgi:hypothetical protein